MTIEELWMMARVSGFWGENIRKKRYWATQETLDKALEDIPKDKIRIEKVAGLPLEEWFKITDIPRLRPVKQKEAYCNFIKPNGVRLAIEESLRHLYYALGRYHPLCNNSPQQNRLCPYCHHEIKFKDSV